MLSSDSGGSRVATSLNDLLGKVDSEQSLLAFVAALVEDRVRAVQTEKEHPSSRYGPDAGGWENTSIERFLEAASAWAESTNFGSTQGHGSDNPWKRFARFLHAGKVYE